MKKDRRLDQIIGDYISWWLYRKLNSFPKTKEGGGGGNYLKRFSFSGQIFEENKI
jgi:hypothetical protein